MEGLLGAPPGLGVEGEIWRPLQFRDLSREPAGVVFIGFTLQIWGKGFERESAEVALMEIQDEFQDSRV